MTDDTLLVRFPAEGAAATTSGPPPEEDAEEQGLRDTVRRLRGKDESVPAKALSDSIEELTGTIRQALDRADNDPTATGRFKIESFTVGLAVTASGRVALVAEVSAEASIQVTFTRR